MTQLSPQDMHQRSIVSPWVITGLLIVLLGLLALPWVPLPADTYLWKAVNDFGHVPMYGAVAIVLLYLVRHIGRLQSWSSGIHYALALTGVMLLGLISEGIQAGLVGRHSEWTDFFRDVAGAVCALGLFLLYDRDLTGRLAVWRQAPRKQLLVIGVGVVMGIVLIPVLAWSYAYWDRAWRFPVICDFSSVWEMKFVHEQDSELRLVTPPPDWETHSDNTVGEVIFYPTHYPGIRVKEPYPQWEEFSSFHVEVFSDLSAPRNLIIRIEDDQHNQEYDDRFNRTVTIFPGFNPIQIALEDIRQAPAGREMNLDAIQSIIIFALSPPEKFSLYIDNLHLE